MNYKSVHNNSNKFRYLTRKMFTFNIIMMPFNGFCWKSTEETTMQYPLGYSIEYLVQLLSLYASISQTKENYKNLEATQFLSNKKDWFDFLYITPHSVYVVECPRMKHLYTFMQQHYTKWNYISSKVWKDSHYGLVLITLIVWALYSFLEQTKM